jgi:3-methyladenine DNA glycosylase Tag
MNKTEQKVMESVKKSGFTFKGDSIFASYAQASRAINGLVKKGLLVAASDKDGRTSYSAA